MSLRMMSSKIALYVSGELIWWFFVNKVLDLVD